MAAGDTEALVRRIATLEAQVQQLRQVLDCSGVGLKINAGGPISINAGGPVSIAAGGGFSLVSGGIASMTAGASIAMRAASSFDLQAMSAISVTAGQNMTLKSRGLKLQQDTTDIMVGKAATISTGDAIGLKTGSAALEHADF